VDAVEIIRAKRDAAPLTPEQIDYFIAGVTSGAIPDYQTTALLMAIRLRGMDARETAALTDAMVRSGVRVDLSSFRSIPVDKHSTGGVGDKTSLILAPLAAACGAIVPMMSGRALGHTGGTLDKLEAIPGFRTRLTLDEFRASLETIGCALIGQTDEVAPADRTLYALRDVTATIDSIPLISASIMSKKIAEGIGALVLDVKCGSGAFMKDEPSARRLAESLVGIGRHAGLRMHACITRMDAPLGRMVGNSHEVVESIETLKGSGPRDLEDLSVLLAARMLELSEAGAPARADQSASRAAYEARVRDALRSGSALEKLRQIIERQGGDPRVVDDYALLPQAPHRAEIRAARAGYVTRLDAGSIGEATMALGAGRATADDPIDPAVGCRIVAGIGDRVREGDPVLEVSYSDAARFERARGVYEAAIAIGDAAPPPVSLVIEEIGDR
jgi:pyrimidine-nucleoside phosphorylase